ncbi:MAG: heme-binding domain-containing protein [Chitinophagaceae bacterium]
MIKKILLILLVVLVIIQFIHPEKNTAEGQQPNYIGTTFSVPVDVKIILAKACNDCHSNNTKYPWYTYIQPVHWWLNNHIIDGKKELNLDEYTSRSLRHQYKKMEEIIEEVKEGKMPLNNYTWLHKNAILTQEEKYKITGWAESVMDTLKGHYPIDSLIRKKQ